MQFKSFLAGGAVAAVLGSIVMAGQISVPHQFRAGSPALASEVNANFDTLVQESNAQDERIGAISGKIDELRSVEQLFCAPDLRPGNGTFTFDGDPVVAFPTPFAQFRNNGTLRQVLYGRAVCVSPTSAETFFETDASQLANEGWRFIRGIDEAGASASFAVTGSPSQQVIWYLYER